MKASKFLQAKNGKKPNFGLRGSQTKVKRFEGKIGWHILLNSPRIPIGCTFWTKIELFIILTKR